MEVGSCCRLPGAKSLVGLSGSVGKREYEGFRACVRAAGVTVPYAGSGSVSVFGSTAFDAKVLLYRVGTSNGGLRIDSMLLTRPFSFSNPTKLDRLSVRLASSLGGERGPGTGSIKWLWNANSLGPQILISCFFWFLELLGANEVVAVFARRNNCSRPLINPDRFTTTVAIMESLRSPLRVPVPSETNQGMTNPYNRLASITPQCSNEPTKDIIPKIR